MLADICFVLILIVFVTRGTLDTLSKVKKKVGDLGCKRFFHFFKLSKVTKSRSLLLLLEASIFSFADAGRVHILD